MKVPLKIEKINLLIKTNSQKKQNRIEIHNFLKV